MNDVMSIAANFSHQKAITAFGVRREFWIGISASNEEETEKLTVEDNDPYWKILHKTSRLFVSFEEAFIDHRMITNSRRFGAAGARERAREMEAIAGRPVACSERPKKARSIARLGLWCTNWQVFDNPRSAGPPGRPLESAATRRARGSSHGRSRKSRICVCGIAQHRCNALLPARSA